VINVSALVNDLYKHIDTKDARGFAAFFAEDGKFTFGNAPTATGPPAVEAACDQFFSSLENLDHEMRNVWEIGDTIICEVTVIYRTLDGRNFELPAANIIRHEDGVVTDYRIFMDVSPLFG
jgi:ketosteroid isomerase-like protein